MLTFKALIHGNDSGGADNSLAGEVLEDEQVYFTTRLAYPGIKGPEGIVDPLLKVVRMIRQAGHAAGDLVHELLQLLDVAFADRAQYEWQVHRALFNGLIRTEAIRLFGDLMQESDGPVDRDGNTVRDSKFIW